MTNWEKTSGSVSGRVIMFSDASLKWPVSVFSAYREWLNKRLIGTVKEVLSSPTQTVAACPNNILNTYSEGSLKCNVVRLTRQSSSTDSIRVLYHHRHRQNPNQILMMMMMKNPIRILHQSS